MERDVEDLILNNTNLIYVILKKLGLYSKTGIDKFYDIGLIGLVNGAKNYKENFGLKPSTYLGKCITNAILMELRKEKKFISLSTPIHENLLLEDMISSDFDIEAELEKNENIKKLYEALTLLKENEKTVLIYSFGLYGNEPLKQKELAEMLGLRQASISRIKLKAIKKLGGILNENKIKN